MSSIVQLKQQLVSVVAALPLWAESEQEARCYTEVCDGTRSQDASTKVHVFVSMQVDFIDFMHYPIFRKFGGNSSCMLGCSCSTCKQCHDETVTIVNGKIWFNSHAVVEAIAATHCFPVSRGLSTLAVVSMYFAVLNSFLCM